MKNTMSGKNFVKLLKDHGWEHDRTEGSHHIMIKGDKTISVPVHGNQDLKKGLFSDLVKEAGLNKKDL